MITQDDIRFALLNSKTERIINLSPVAVALVADLLNAFIYEYENTGVIAVAERQHLAVDFVFKELPSVLDEASDAWRAKPYITAIDLMHWLSPRWPRTLRGNKTLGFIFDKE